MQHSSGQDITIQPDHSKLNRYLQQASATKLLGGLVLALTLAEVTVMLLLHQFFPDLPLVVMALTDALLLLAVIFPTLYLLLFRPLTLQISRLHAAETSLRESESTIMALMNSLSESAFLLEDDGRVITLNLTAANRLGKEREQVIGTCIFDHFPPDIAGSRRTMVEQVVRTGQSVRFQDIRHERHYDITIAPVTGSSGQVVKLALFAFDTTDFRDAEHLLKTNALALERSNNEIRLLGKMSETLQSCHNLDEAYGVLAKFANQLFPEESGGLYILNAEHNQLEVVSFWGDVWISSEVISPEDCWGMRRGRLHVCRDLMVDVQCNHLGEAGEYHYYCLPLMARSETLGLLHLRMDTPRDVAAQLVQQTKEQLLESMAEHMALAIANLRLRDQLHTLSTRDPLTGVYNRRFMEESLVRELCQAERTRRSLGVIMLDIDHFKTFNDTYGHEIGDLLLKEMGGFLQQQVRGGDIVCRYGGEEFILILPGAGEQESLQRAEQLRAGVKTIAIQHDNNDPAPVSVSLGVAISPACGRDVSRLLKAVDDALYRAKREGRDRVCRAEALPSA